jgi:branched-chain amino acid transport system permease protein
VPNEPHISETVRRLDFSGALKDAAVAAVVALGLFSLMLGLLTGVGPSGMLTVSPRPGLAIAGVAAVFVGRFLVALVARSRRTFYTGPLVPVRLRNRVHGLKLNRCVVPVVLIAAISFPFLFFSNRYLLDLGILVLTYTMLAWGLNIVVGLAGLLDLGYVAFYAVGAYSYALLATHFGLSFWICLPLAGILASFWGILLGFPVLRLRGDYLAIVTLAFGEIIRIVIVNWQDLTGGPNGISGIPRPSFFGLPFDASDQGFAAHFGLEFTPTHRVVFLYYLILALALVTCAVTIRLRQLPIGRAWEALREDEIACRALGINTTNTKLTAFATGAMFAGFAGSFFATRQGFISPESFVFMESALVLAIVVLGGMGSQIGVAVAAFVMIGGFELFRNFEQFRMLVFGAAMAGIMVWRPRGLVATRTPSIFLEKKKDIPADIIEEARQ